MNSFFTYFILLFGLPCLSQAQICNGTLGDNIFTEGDFGAGPDNILPFDPGIAPGYVYQLTPPPNDGFYTITNDMTLWANNFNWIEIQDNSPNPFGYMMIVNATYDPGLFYRKQVDGLCENTNYAFSVDVFNLIPPGNNLIRPNISFLIDGQVVHNTGNVPENQQWITYGFTFSTQPGQTTLTLSLANNAPGGGGNDIALDNISFRPCGPEARILPEQTAYVCEDGNPIVLSANIIGSQYPSPNLQWQSSQDGGLTWQNIPGATDTTYVHNLLSAGLYYYRYLIANDAGNISNAKCRVVSEVRIVEVIAKYYGITDSLCEGTTFNFGGQVISSSGRYLDSLVSVHGCDSIVTLDLVIVPDKGISAEITAKDPTCSYLENGLLGADSVWDGAPPFSYFLDGNAIASGTFATQLAAGSYVYTVRDRFGCRFDTTVTLVAPAPFVVDLFPDWEVNMGDSVRVETAANYPVASYAWWPDWVSCATACSPVGLQPRTTGFLTVHATSDAGCTAEDSVFIKVNEVRKVFIPNAFTPNGDGLNDLFTIWADAPSAQQVDQLTIFDRWGSVVFERRDFALNAPDLGWDGAVGSKTLPEGVYPYLARIRFLDGKVFVRSGTVMLLR